MTNYNQLIWEISDEAAQDPYSVYDKILSEFHKTESELKEQLDSDMPISRDLLDLRKKLNKLLAKTAPFMIEEYNFLKQYHKQERANQ